ncbi:putative cytoplasmic protein [Salmonella enterica subsp. enterica]|uniref:Putative cytoplasmic protein n=1 Tax=Salmonella enterica I TaxID=59201 RepID=A0A3S5DM69_SALET|nr:putative cytoplasmic protein [Salmonella enterica subsp. enterica]
MYYLRPDLTVTGYLYRYLSDYIWLNFFSAQMRFPSSNVTIGGPAATHFSLMGSPLIPLFWGIILWTKTIQQTRLEEGSPAKITVRNAAPKNFKVHRYFDNPVASPRSSVTDEGEKAGQK